MDCNDVTTFNVFLLDSPNSTWISPNTERDGVCCGQTGKRCLRFIVHAHSDATTISFNIATPPIPPGQFYQYECGDLVSAGQPLCVSGSGPHCIVYCKPGGDMSKYSITISQTVHVSPDIGVNEGCSGLIWASGLTTSSIQWNSVYPGVYGEYNNYLSCTTACDTTYINVLAGYPPYIDFEVSGGLDAPCTGINIKDTVRVYFYSDLDLNISPIDPVICFGESNFTLTANPAGGNPPYSYLWSTGETTQTINVGVGTYWVEMSDNTVCPPLTDTVTVIQFAAPITANAGSNLSACETSPTVQLNGNITVAQGGIWTGGNGTFNPSNEVLNPTYTPTADELIAGTVSLTLTSTGNFGCPLASDQMTIAYLPSPIVDAGSNVTVCANNSGVYLSGSVTNASQYYWSSSGSGYFSPNIFDINAIYTPSNEDANAGSIILTLTTLDGCEQVSDNLTVNIIPAPQVNAGPDLLICNTDASFNLSGTVSGSSVTGQWTSSGNGSFSPSNTSLNATYNISADDINAGSIIISLTSTFNGICQAVSDNLVVTFLAPAIVNAGSDAIICIGDIINLQGEIIGGSGTGIWTTPNGTGTFQPSHTNLTTTYVPSAADYAAGFISLTLTSTQNGTCLPAYDNLVASFFPPPVVFAGPDQVICANNPYANLYGSVTGVSQVVWTSSGTGTFIPDANTINAVYEASPADTTAGTVVLTLTGIDGCTEKSDQMNITITKPPWVYAGDDIYICPGDISANLSGYVTNGTTTGTWTSLGGGTFLPNANALNAEYNLSQADIDAGYATLILSSTNNGYCLPVKDTLKIYIVDGSSISISGPSVVCSNDVASLTATVTGGSGTGIWTSPNGQGAFVPSATDLNTTYVVASADTITGTVLLIFTSTQSCANQADTIFLQVIPGPYVNAGNNQIVCSTNNTISLNGIMSNWALPPLWTSAGTGSFAPNNQLNTTYSPSALDISNGYVDLYLSSTGSSSCPNNTDTVRIDFIYPPTVNAGVNNILCANSSLNLNGIINGGSGEGIWTTNGDGYFVDGVTSLTNTYYPGVFDILNGSVNLTLTSTNNYDCNPSSDVLNVTITPAPIVDAGLNQNLCKNNSTVNLNGSVSNAGGGSWATSGTGVFSPINTLLSTSYLPSTADLSAGSVWLYLTSTDNGLCNSVVDSLLVTFYNPPNVYAGSDYYICPGTASVPLSGSITGITTSGIWSSLGSGSFISSPTQLNANYYLSSADNTNGYATLILSSTNNLGCLPVTDTVKVFITDIVTVNAGADQAICANNSAVSLSGSVNGSPPSIIWSSPNGNGVFAPSDTLLQTVYYPGTIDIIQGYVNLVLMATASCLPSRDTLRVNISPSPIVYAGPDILVCAEAAQISLNGQVSGVTTTGNWASNGDGVFLPSSDVLNANYVPGANDIATGNVRLILSSTNNGLCNTVRDTLILRFGKSPLANFNSPLSACVNQEVSFVNTSTIPEGSIVAWEWFFGASFYSYTEHTTFNFPSPGIYQVRLIVSSNIGCKDTIYKSINIHPLPQPSFSFDSQCANQPVTFIDNSLGNPVSWQWIFGNGQVSGEQNPPPQMFDPPGSYVVILQISDINACINQIQQNVLMHQLPQPAAIYSDVCQGSSLQFIDVSVVANDTIISWLWDFGDGNNSMLKNPTNTYLHEGSYNVSLTVGTQWCQNSVDFTVNVSPLPVISVIPSSTEICPLQTIFFDNQTTGATSYFWSFGDGVSSTLESPSHTFINQTLNPIIYNVKLVAYAASGCIDSLFIPITVNPKPIPIINSDAVPSCSPLEVNFINLSQGANNYNWNFGDGQSSQDENPSHVFINETTYINYFNVILTAYSSFGCIDSTVYYVTVFPNTDYDFTINPSSGCHPLTSNIQTIPGAYSYYWDYGDGTGETAGPNVYHTFTNTGETDTTYTVKLISHNMFGCIDSTEHNITVYPTPIINIVPDIMIGCPPLEVNFSGSSSGADSFIFYFGNGDSLLTNEPEAIYTYLNNTGSIASNMVNIIAENSFGCKATSQHSISVYPAPTANFIMSDTVGCPPFGVNFLNFSTGSSSFLWDFNNGNFSTNSNPSQLFLNTNQNIENYNIQLTSISPYGCRDSITKSISVYPKPEANFSLSKINGCSPLVVNFENQSVGANSNFWNFGNGTQINTSQTYLSNTYINQSGLSNSFLVQLIVQNTYNCTDTMQQSIQVFPEVSANFINSPTGCSPHQVFFTNQSQGANNYFWNFGNGVTSNNTNPSQLFENNTQSTISFNVQLTATSHHNCRDSIIKQISVYPKPKADFNINKTSGCSPLLVGFSNQSVGANQNYWNFGDGNQINSSQPNLSNTYNNLSAIPANYLASLIVVNSFGCSDSMFQSIQVFPKISANFICDTIGCAPLQVSFVNETEGSNTYSWNFGNGASSSNTNPSQLFVNNGQSIVNYNITLTAISSYSCRDSITKQLSVYPSPDAVFNLTNNNGCSPLTVGFQNATIGASNYFWNYGDGNESNNTQTIFNHSYVNQTGVLVSYVASLVAENSYGCRDSISQTVQVYPELISNFICDTVGCSPLQVSFMNQTIGANTFYWTFGDGGSSSNVSPSHTYENISGNEIIYNASLISTSSYNCRDTLIVPIKVYPAPNVIIAIDSIIGCSPFEARIVNSTSGGTSFNWSFGDGSTGSSSDTVVYHTYYNLSSQTSSYVINLQASNIWGCFGSANHAISVFPQVESRFTCDTIGCSPLYTSFNNNSINASSYFWNFGDGANSTAFSPIHTFTNNSVNDSIFIVSLTTSSIYGCHNTVYKEVLVYATPFAEFFANPTYQVYPSAKVDIENNTLGSWNYFWDFGDNTYSSLQHPQSHTYSTWGEYSIMLIVTSANCRDTIIQTIIIDPHPPIAKFESDTAGCVPLTIKFSNTSEYASHYKWNFGDGSQSTAVNPEHTYYQTGLYAVSMIATGPGGQVMATPKMIIVYPNPTAFFQVAPAIVAVPNEAAHFFNLSEFADSCLWNFGDGSIDTTYNPIHYYQQEGIYDVLLEVWTKNGCYDSFTIPSAITALSECRIMFPNAFTPDVSYSSGGKYTLPNTTNDIFFPIHQGIIEFHIEIYNRWGELIFVSDDINIGWDGWYRGEVCKQDVYIWKAYWICTGGKKYNDVGDVLLLR